MVSPSARASPATGAAATCPDPSRIFSASGSRNAASATPRSRNGVRPSTACAIRQRSSFSSRSCGSQSASRSPAPAPAASGRRPAAAASAAAMPSRQPIGRVRRTSHACRSCRARHRAAAAPPRAHCLAIAAVAGKHLVTALAGQHHLHVLAGTTGEEPRGDDRVVQRRIVHTGNDFRQMLPDHGLGDLDGFVPRAERLRHDRGAARVHQPAGASQPAVKASTGWLFSRAISASTVALSIPPERNMPYGTSLRWCRSTLSSSARSRRVSAVSSSIVSGPPSGRWETRRRSSTRPSEQVTVSPGSRRWMPSKIVSAPVVN